MQFLNVFGLIIVGFPFFAFEDNRQHDKCDANDGKPKDEKVYIGQHVGFEISECRFEKATDLNILHMQISRCCFVLVLGSMVL